MALHDIRALCFDVFGTVVDWRNSIAAEVETTMRNQGIEVDSQAFALAWRALYQPAMSKIRAGNRGFVKLDDLHRENLREVLKSFDIGDQDNDTIDHLNTAWHRLNPWPDVVDGLKRLKTKYILATLSNGNVALMVNMAKHADLAWDVILGAEIARAYKPQPEAYQNAADLLGLKPAQCLMVAAHNDDLVAAGAIGIRTAFVARPDEYGSDQTTDQKAGPDVDVAARDFADLAQQLGC